MEDNKVWDCLRNLKVHESVEPDDIHRWALREWAEKMATALTIIFEMSQQSTVVPSDWLRGNRNSQF